jgi:hypothetical protein
MGATEEKEEKKKEDYSRALTQPGVGHLLLV